MFSDFKKALFKKNEYHVPKEIVQGMNSRLPEGFEYKQLSPELFRITPIDGSPLRFKGKVDLPDNVKVIGSDDIMLLLYRTQTSITLKKDDHFEVNGNQIPISDIFKYPFDESKDYNIKIDPPEFPEAFEVAISGNGKSQVLSIRQQPFNDLSTVKFRNIDGGVLDVTLLFKESTSELTITISFSIDRASRVEELVSALLIYQSFYQGDGVFWNMQGLQLTQSDMDRESLSEVINYWNKVKALQDLLPGDFELEGPLTDEQDRILSALYINLVQKKPFKEYIKIKTLSMKPGENFDEALLIGQEQVGFTFPQNETIEILGQRIDVFQVQGIFDLKVTSVVPTNIDDKVSLVVENATGKKTYKSFIRFLSEADADDYFKANGLSALQEAEELYSM